LKGSVDPTVVGTALVVEHLDGDPAGSRCYADGATVSILAAYGCAGHMGAVTMAVHRIEVAFVGRA
jgi:hypothetical protein